MDRSAAKATLSQYEQELADGSEIDLWGGGFWRVVAWVKRQPDQVEEFADRIARIDQAGFDQGVKTEIPISLGAPLLWGVTLVGLGLIALTYYLDQPWNWLFFGAGTALFGIASHPLAHFVVGRSVGIRFTKIFLGFERQVFPEPGVKIDYATYLRTPARKRAWMHAAGAITTKLVPLLLIPVVFAAELPIWVFWVLVALEVVAITFDLTFSTKASDWKRFSREMGIARELTHHP